MPPGADIHNGDPAPNPWAKLLAGGGLGRRRALDAIHGGNELANSFSSDWAMVDGSMQEGFYVVARGGPNFSANEGSQTKISRYIPDGNRGFKLKWRTGREAMQRLAEPGEIYGAIHLHKPINGLLSIVDQSRCGILLYTDDGLYVDTIFPDGRRFSPAVAGVYPQPGEFFAGAICPNEQNGKIYFAMGKYTTLLFEAQGWSLKENPVRVLENVQKTVDIDAAQIASPPEIALSVRGGGTARLTSPLCAPALLGGVTLDGSMAGWESCELVAFSGRQGADRGGPLPVRSPDHLYLRAGTRGSARNSRPNPCNPSIASSRTTGLPTRSRSISRATPAPSPARPKGVPPMRGLSSACSTTTARLFPLCWACIRNISAAGTTRPSHLRHPCRSARPPSSTSASCRKSISARKSTKTAKASSSA